MLTCRDIDSSGVVLDNGHQEGLGYQYSDVQGDGPQTGLAVGQDMYTYASVNNQTKTRVMDGAELTLTFEFRDWKYLSQVEQFTQVIKNTSVIAGLAPQKLEIDFNKMTQRDQTNGTRFEVAGRMYWEAHVFGSGYNSFTTNGFFDKEGYVEPMMSPSAIAMAKYYWVWIVVGITILSLIGCYCCFCRTTTKLKNKSKVNEGTN